MLKVTDVDYLGKYTLLCTFSTGEKKKVDLTPLLQYPAFEELKDEKQFIQFGLDGTIFWANGADIAPEYLYDNGILENYHSFNYHIENNNLVLNKNIIIPYQDMVNA